MCVLRSRNWQSVSRRLEPAVHQLQEAIKTACAVSRLNLFSQHAQPADCESILVMLLKHSELGNSTISASPGTWAT